MITPGGKTYRPSTPNSTPSRPTPPPPSSRRMTWSSSSSMSSPSSISPRSHAFYQDETRGAPPFDPAMMVCLLLYAYCVGVFSSRKIAQACERNLAFLAIVGNDRPDFRTISLFRKLHLDAFTDLFVQVLHLAQEAGLVQLGALAIDGTKIRATPRGTRP